MHLDPHFAARHQSAPPLLDQLLSEALIAVFWVGFFAYLLA